MYENNSKKSVWKQMQSFQIYKWMEINLVTHWTNLLENELDIRGFM